MAAPNRIMRITAVAVVAVAAVACSSADRTSRHAGGSGFSVDHPPLGAYLALLDFTRCMRSHRVQMRTPVGWRGHNRLTVYHPPRNPVSDAAYCVCDHFRVLAKQHGGPH